jgi:CRP-like cAMP-binding protein
VFPRAAERGARVIGRALLDHLSRLGELCDQDRNAVLELPGELKTFKRNEDIAKEGAVPCFSTVVVSGFLQRYVSRSDGSRQIHSFYIPGDAPSLESLQMDCIDSNLGAAVKSEVALIPHSDLHDLMQARPSIQKLFWKSTVVQSSLYREWLMRNSRHTADSAMAHMFCEIYTRCAVAGLVDGNSCEMPLTQEMLGDALGLTGVHVNRTLQHLRDTGFVDHHRGRLFLHNFNGLADFSDFDPAYLHLGNGHAR